MKSLLVFYAFFLTAVAGFGQSGLNYYETGIGAGFSYQRGYTNITRQYSQFGVNGNYIYFFNPYFPIEAETQIGRLSGGGSLPSQDQFGREYHNLYGAIILHGDIMLGVVIDYDDSRILNVLKNFYGGIGLGALYNNNHVTRYSIYRPPYPQPGYYKFPGEDRGLNLTIPLRFGYQFKIYYADNIPRFFVDIGYIHSVVVGEGLDGYDDPATKFKNNAPDQYRQINITFKFSFGNFISYNKLIRPFNYSSW